MIGGPLARFAEPSPAALAPRARRVLKCLLEGDSDKQIAARLGLSVNTVNWYAKQIHGHFGVQTRGTPGPVGEPGLEQQRGLGRRGVA